MGDEKDKQDGVGFAGISSLLSDESADGAMQQPDADSSTADPRPGASQSTANNASPAVPAHTVQSQSPPDTTRPAPPQNGGHFAIWAWIGIAVVIFIIWAASQSSTQSSNQTATQPVAQTDPDTQPAASGQAGQANTAAAVATQPAEPLLQRPSVGAGNLLTTAEIRYCLAMKERVEAAKPIVNTYSQGQVDRFNEMVDEYNSRCRDFRYYSASLQQAQRDIESYAQQYRSQGVQWVLYGDTRTANTQAPPNQPTSRLTSRNKGNDSTQSTAVARTHSQPRRTRHNASTSGALLDASFVRARQLGSCSPTYPIEAARLGRSGTTTLAVRVGTDGGVTSVRIVSSSGSTAMDRAAVDAMEQCQFAPATRDGRVVIDDLTIPVHFTFSQSIVSPDATGNYQ